VGSRFLRNREDFTCEHCGEPVLGDGYTNHCPHCLWSKHVDVHPGDRAATCGSLMEPIAAISKSDGTTVIQRCTACGHLWRNRSAAHDNRDALLALVGRPVPERPGRRSRRTR
jgi:hypothetical protein